MTTSVTPVWIPPFGTLDDGLKTRDDTRTRLSGGARQEPLRKSRIGDPYQRSTGHSDGCVTLLPAKLQYNHEMAQWSPRTNVPKRISFDIVLPRPPRRLPQTATQTLARIYLHLQRILAQHRLAPLVRRGHRARLYVVPWTRSNPTCCSGSARPTTPPLIRFHVEHTS